METGRQRLDVDDVYRTILSHLSLNLAINPILVLHYLLAANAGFFKRHNEAFCHLRTPHTLFVLHADGEGVETRVQR